MHILTVIPIARGTPLATLSYASPTAISAGNLIHVPFRKSTIPAIVESCTPAENEKAMIKQLHYQIRTMKSDPGTPFLRPEFMEAAHRVAAWYVGTVGSVLAALVPLPILRARVEAALGATDTIADHHNEQLIFQAEHVERGAMYKSIIREEFAKRHSVLLVLPTLEDLEHMRTVLGRGIEDFTHVFHGGLSPKKLVTAWKDILTADHPVLILGTPQSLAIPRTDIGTIIIDKESANGYRGFQRPYIDYRRVAEEVARGYGARLIFGDTFLRVETLWRSEAGEFQELLKPKYRLLTNAICDLVDLRGKEQPATGNAALVSPQLEHDIARLTQEHARMVILGTRKGYAPMTVCGDCGSIVACKVCSSPVVLYKGTQQGGDDNFFLCHRCGVKRSASERCTSCDSWRLIPLGAGLDKAEEIVRAIAPGVKVFRMDRDHVTSHVEAKKLMEAFVTSPGSVLLGTEMCLPYLHEPVEYGAILSLQSLLTIPDYAVEEKAFRLIVNLRTFITKHLIVQTRDKKPEFYQWALQGNLLDCYRSEIEARKMYAYPPFSLMVKLTILGSKDMIDRTVPQIRERFAPFTPIVFPGFIAKMRHQFRMHALISTPRQTWPMKELTELLHDLPPGVNFEVDPEDLI